jgi:outer membrane protein assembly factor BamB
VFHGNTILVGGAAGRGLHLLTRTTGALLQTLPATAAVESEATLSGNHVYFSDTGGDTWCYTLDGEFVWHHDGRAPVLTRPLVDDGQVFITDVDDLGVALDAETGALLWRHKAKKDLTREAELALYAAPPAKILGDMVLFGFSTGSLVAVKRATGEEQWARRVGEGRYPDLVAEPVAFGSDLYTSGYFQPLVAVDQDTQNVRWRMDVGAASAVLITEDGMASTVYHPGTDGVLRAISALTGAEHWSWDSGSSGALTTPVMTEAGLIIASSESGVSILNAKNGTARWTYQGDRILSGVTVAPAIDGRQMVFVSNSGWIYSMLSPVAHPIPRAWPR